MNIDEIKEKLCEIKQMGYVVSKRKGDTGIGYTLETLLGLKENNFKTPDFGQIELKSRRKGRNSRITMFTLNRNVWIIDKKEVIERYGYLDKKDRKALKCTINSKPNNQGFYVRVEQAGVRIYHAEGQLTTEWQRDYLIETFKEKMSNLLIVNADTRRNSDKNEEFWYNEAFLLTQLNAENFLDFIRNDIIIIDLRMHIKENGSVRNRGTGFRIHPKDWNSCYNSQDRLI